MAYTTITGNIGKDIELKHSQNGKPFTRFSVAWSERYKDKTGEYVDGPTVWVSVSAFGKTAENAAQSLHKGVRAIITGQLRPETWNSNNGEETVFTMTADSVGPDLTFQTAQVQKSNGNGGGGNFGGGQFNSQPAQGGGFGGAQHPQGDPWNSQPQQGGFGGQAPQGGW